MWRKLSAAAMALLSGISPAYAAPEVAGVLPSSPAAFAASGAGSIALAALVVMMMLALFSGWRRDDKAAAASQAAKEDAVPNGQPADAAGGSGANPIPIIRAGAGSNTDWFEMLFQRLPVPAIRCDAEGRIVAWNSASEEIYGKKADAVTGKHIWQVIARPPHHGKLQQIIQNALEGNPSERVETQHSGPNGAVHVLCTTFPLRDAGGAISGVVSIHLDNTDQKKTAQTLHLAQETYHNLIVNSPQGIFRIAPDGWLIEANPALSRIFGYDDPAEMLEDLRRGKSDIGRKFFVDPVRYEQMLRLLQQKGEAAQYEVQIKRGEDEILWLEINAQAVRGEGGQIAHFEGTIEDVSKRKQAEERLLHDALHDKLTGLPNRALFMERLGRSLSRTRRMTDYRFAVLFVDLDRFKNVNDSLGHLAGDQLLQMTSRKLEACVRPGDTVARMGGDEFALLLDDIESDETATHVADRIQKRLSMPMRINNQEIFSTASIGIVLGDAQYQQPEDLLRDSDMAMYKAKTSGKAHHEFFDIGMKNKATTLLQLESDLRRAVQRNEFKLEYQPIVSLVAGRIAGFEALVRWRHPERGTVSPGDFIPLAEDTGLILPIGRWALREACRQITVWQNSSRGKMLPLTMAVNLSARQFGQPDLVRYVEGVLRQCNLDPRYLKLEITESVIMGNADAATAMLLQLKELGVKLSIDDFGTGYSSLSYLHRFPINSLKIDRSFVSRMDVSDENEEIVRTIVTLAHNLKMDVIAEGVETAEQLAHLRALECHYGQGYYFGGPMDGTTAGAFIAAQPQW